MRDEKPSEISTRLMLDFIAPNPNRIELPSEIEMTNGVKSSSSGSEDPYGQADRRGSDPNNWLRVGLVAAASAVLGGLAAGWFYRKTVSRLQEAENEIPDYGPESTEDGTREDF